MSTIASLLVATLGLIHIAFAYAEAFKWDMLADRLLPKPEDHKEWSSQVLETTGLMAKNTAIYNFFVGLGLLWSLTLDAALQSSVAMYFAIFVIGAGVVGYVTTKSKIILAAQIGLGVIVLGFVYIS